MALETQHSPIEGIVPVNPDEAFTKLMDEHFQRLVNRHIVHGIDPHVAEDLAQEAFISLLEHTKTIRWENESETKRYLSRTDKNKRIDYFRWDPHARGRIEEDELEIIPEWKLINDQQPLEDAIIQKQDAQEKTERVNQILRNLGKKQQELLRLVYQEEKPYSEIAQELNTTELAIKLRMHRIKQKINDMLLTTEE
jgi:RNA polymerase sigma-70 factor (ECF subfamily)